MNDTKQTPEANRSTYMHPGITAMLEPTAPNSMKIALSNKQNFAMAAEEIFNHALRRTIWNYRTDYMALDEILKEVKNTAMESVATARGIERISNMVFGPNGSALREFLFSLRVQFSSQFGEFFTMWNDLIGDIANSLTGGYTSSDADPSACLVPEEILERTMSSSEMKQLLLANTWLIMFILIILWGRALNYDELRANYKLAVGSASAIP